MAGARNPKEVRLSVYLTSDMNTRLEAVADRAGLNKGVMLAFCIAVGVSGLEPIFQIKLDETIDQLANAKLSQLASDLEDIQPGYVSKPAG